MITQKDIKNLKFFTTKSANVVYLITIFIPIFLLIMGVLNFQLALKIGKNAGYDPQELVHNWIEGIEVDKQYSGLYLMSLSRIQKSITDFVFAIASAFLPFVFSIMKKRNARILDILYRHNILKD